MFQPFSILRNKNDYLQEERKKTCVFGLSWIELEPVPEHIVKAK